MDRVTHREMRNRIGEILRRVAAGESIEISKNGRAAAIIVPVGGNELDSLIARGEACAARTGVESLSRITRGRSEAMTREVIEDSRGRW